MPRTARLASLLTVGSAAIAGAGALCARRGICLDVDVGRRIRPLGPIAVQMAAPPEIVFDVVAGPYLGRTPRALRDKLEVLERGSDMVLAAHRTRVGPLTVLTVETVRFERPHRVTFRLLRGPVPHVVETYALTADGEGTAFEYAGEIGADLWAAGALWADAVAGPWERAVADALEGIRAEAERRASSARRAASRT